MQVKNQHCKPRNQHCKPKTEVPIKTRLTVYKKLLRLLLKYPQFNSDDDPLNTDIYDRISNGLCLMIPCVLWNLDDCYNNSNNKYYMCKNWEWQNTDILFPELALHKSSIVNLVFHYDKYLQRIKVVQLMINEIENGK